MSDCVTLSTIQGIESLRLVDEVVSLAALVQVVADHFTRSARAGGR